MAVCAVRVVPTNRGSLVSDNAVENTGESAMTDAPHTARKATRTAVGAVNRNGEARQQIPLTASGATAAGDRPNRSDAQPASTHPAAPASPIVAKVVSSAAVWPRRSWPVSAKTETHDHSAYSSHMCPR